MSEERQLPSREYMQAQSSGNKEPEEATTIEDARNKLASVTMKALLILEKTMDDPEASNADKIRAARQAIDLGHGKDAQALKINVEKQNSAKMVAKAIENAKRRQPNPTSTDIPGHHD